MATHPVHAHEFKPLSDHAIYCECGKMKTVACTHWHGCGCTHHLHYTQPYWFFSTWNDSVTTGISNNVTYTIPGSST